MAPKYLRYALQAATEDLARAERYLAEKQVSQAQDVIRGAQTSRDAILNKIAAYRKALGEA